jgi:hypothetical protein
MHPKGLIYKNPNVNVLTILGLTFTVKDSRPETKILFDSVIGVIRKIIYLNIVFLKSIFLRVIKELFYFFKS